jgi:hypothetical protein
MAFIQGTKALGSLNAEAFWVGSVILATQASEEVGVAAVAAAGAVPLAKATEDAATAISAAVSFASFMDDSWSDKNVFREQLFREQRDNKPINNLHAGQGKNISIFYLFSNNFVICVVAVRPHSLLIGNNKLVRLCQHG